jgi:hypothetical protein
MQVYRYAGVYGHFYVQSSRLPLSLPPNSFFFSSGLVKMYVEPIPKSQSAERPRRTGTVHRLRYFYMFKPGVHGTGLKKKFLFVRLQCASDVDENACMKMGILWRCLGAAWAL